MNKVRAYLDIETTGLSRDRCSLTVVGIAIENGDQMRVVQLVGGEITAGAVRKSLEEITEVYTYNGSRFDLPFIKSKIDVDIKKEYAHRDLMYDCWKQDLKGGLKKVEQTLGIARNTAGIDGYVAVVLWWDYVTDDNEGALETLLEYNKEDVINLKSLRLKLKVD